MLLRRQHIQLFLLTLFTFLIFASCAKEDITDASQGKRLELIEGTPYSVMFKFKTGDSDMRAYSDDAGSGDYVHGSTDEYKISNNGSYVYFFDEDKKFYRYSLLTQQNKENGTHHEGDIDAYYGAKFYPIKGKNMSYCIVVLNGGNMHNQLMNAITAGSGEYSNDIERVLSQIWTDNSNVPQIGRDAGLFTMTNSVYMGKDGMQAAVEITDDNILTVDKVSNIPDFPEDPEDMKKIVQVHVERMVAKFSLNISGGDETHRYFTPTFTSDDNKNLEAERTILFDAFTNDQTPKYKATRWRIKVTGWNINALESQNYLFKKINSNDKNLEGWDWNGDCRSYWSQDLHYDNDEQDNPLLYPWQYRKAIDYTLNYYGDKYQGESNNGNILKNYSFNYLNDNDFDKVVYTPENTYDKYAVKGNHDKRDELLAGTHLIVGAELQIEEIANSGDYKTPDDLYRDRNGFYYLSERACIASLIHSFNQLLTSQDALLYTYHSWWDGENTEGNEKTELVANPRGACNLYYGNTKLTAKYIMDLPDNEYKSLIGELTPATIRHGDGKRFPWNKNWFNGNNLTVKYDNGQVLDICAKDLDGYETVIPGRVIRKATNDDIKSLFYEWLGTVDHFSQGKMYYAQGIDNPTAGEEKPERYGVVRNNWYRFNITDIKSIGIPVDDPTQPIIPERVGLNDQINFKIKIIPWHYIGTGYDFSEF